MAWDKSKDSRIYDTIEMALDGSENSEGDESIAINSNPSRRMSVVALGLLFVGLAVGSATWISHRPQRRGDTSMLIEREEGSAIFSSEEEGIETVQEFLETFRAAFKSGDMADLQKKFADDVEWKWSGGVSGSGTSDDLFKGPDSVVGKAWGALIDEWIASGVFTVVDAASGETFTSFECTLPVDGRGKLPISSSTLVSVHDVYELHFNSEKKVVYWGAFFNSLDPGMTKALANIFPLVYDMKAPPAPDALLTEKEANEWVEGFMEHASKAFATNDMEKLAGICADDMSWDFSGDNKGQGTKEEFGSMLSDMLPSSAFVATDIFTTVDGEAGEIIATFELLLLDDGHGKSSSGATPESIITFRSAFHFHVDEDKKLTALKGRWNALDVKFDS